MSGVNRDFLDWRTVEADPITGALGRGLYIPQYDYTSLSQDATHDVWSFYLGGAGGTLIATVTITYTDATKATIANVAKS